MSVKRSGPGTKPGNGGAIFAEVMGAKQTSIAKSKPKNFAMVIKQVKNPE